MSQNEILIDTESKRVEVFYLHLKDNRASYVMDRVAFTQVFYLIFTGFITSLIRLFDELNNEYNLRKSKGGNFQ